MEHSRLLQHCWLLVVMLKYSWLVAVVVVGVKPAPLVRLVVVVVVVKSSVK